MVSPAGFWAGGTIGDPDNMNSGLLQYAAYASRPTATNLTGMMFVSSDGKAGNGGPPALYRSDGTATWVFVANLFGFHGCKIKDASTQSISHDTITAIAFDTEDFDTDAFHDTSTNNSRITIPTGLDGKYLVFGGFNDDTMAGDNVGVTLRVNGSTYGLGNISTSTGAFLTIAYAKFSCFDIFDLSATDYVELMAYRDDIGAVAGNISVQYFGAMFLGG